MNETRFMSPINCPRSESRWKSGGEITDEGVGMFWLSRGTVLHIYDALFQQDKINHYLCTS